MCKMDRGEGEKGWEKGSGKMQTMQVNRGLISRKGKKGLKGREIGEGVEKKVRESRRIGRGV